MYIIRLIIYDLSFANGDHWASVYFQRVDFYITRYRPIFLVLMLHLSVLRLQLHQMCIPQCR